MDILCIGNATIDVFVDLTDPKKFSYDKFSNQLAFKLGEKIPLGKYELSLGGNACNVSVALSRLAFKTSLAAEVGSDEFSQKILNTLSKEKVDQSFMNKNLGTTPYFNIVLTYSGERTIFEEEKPIGEELNLEEVNPRLIYLTSFHGDWNKAYNEAISKNPNALIALNPGSKQLRESLNQLLELLPKVEILFVNLQEAHTITGDQDPDVKTVLKKLKTWGIEVAVVTDGMNGSYGIDKNNTMFQLGVLSNNPPIERTGAGDSYAAGFIYGYLNGFSVEESLRFGALNADSVIRVVGAQNGLLTKDEIELKSKENLGFTAVKI